MKGIYKFGIAALLVFTITTASATTQIGDNITAANNVTAQNFLGYLNWAYLLGIPTNFPNSTLASYNGDFPNSTSLKSVSGTLNRINVTGGNTIDIATNWIGQTAITTIGTITTGTWQGTGITAAYISSVNGSNITSGIIPTARYLDAVNTSADLYNINVSNATSGTLPISRGGTGQTTQTAAFNALSPTTTKGDLIVNSSTSNVNLPVGADYQSLIANSSATNGVNWGLPNGTLFSKQVLTSGTTYTPTAGTKRIMIELWGGGGAGGGVSATASGAGGGGGSGGYARYYLNNVAAASYTIAIGTGGTGVSGANGNAGTATTFNTGAVTITANGGSGGAFTAGSVIQKFAAGGSGAAISTNGDYNGGGVPGTPGMTFSSATLAMSGNGGSTSLGGGGVGKTTSGAGSAADANTGSGGGGAACVTTGAAAAAGGNGAAGVIYVWEFT